MQRTSALEASLTQSSSERKPLLSLLESTSASVESILVASCSLDISSENTATSLLECLATFVAIFSANEVLPIPGRAASIIRSDLLRPVVIVSRRVYPVFAPRYFSLSGPEIF